MIQIIIVGIIMHIIMTKMEMEQKIICMITKMIQKKILEQE